MTKTVAPAIWDLARSVLDGATRVWIESLAQRLQAECDDSRMEYEAWLEEQRSLKGLTDEQRERI